MDFDFILSSQDFNAPRPTYGNMHQGFRLGLGLDLNFLNLHKIDTKYRSITDFAGEGVQTFNGWQQTSAFDILAKALTRAIGGYDLGVLHDHASLRKSVKRTYMYCAYCTDP